MSFAVSWDDITNDVRLSSSASGWSLSKPLGTRLSLSPMPSSRPTLARALAATVFDQRAGSSAILVRTANRMGGSGRHMPSAMKLSVGETCT